MSRHQVPVTSQVPLSAVTIAGLSDGYLGKQIDAEILKIFQDLEDRGQDGCERKLTVEISFKMKVQGRVRIVPKVKTKLPDHVPYETIAITDKNAGGILFRPDFAENPEQRSILDGEIV